MNQLFKILGISAFLWFLAAPPTQAATAPVETQTFDNGITLITRTDRIAPRVAISVLVPAGMTDETAATAGWRRLLTEAMLRATKPENGEIENGETENGEAGVLLTRDITRAAERLGGQLGASVADDVIEFWIEGDSSQTAELLDLLLSVARTPRLTDEDIAAARRRLQQRLEDTNESTQALGAATRTLQTLRGQLYRNADDQPIAYGLPANGTVESLQNITAAQLRDYHARFFAPRHLTVSAAGDVDAAALSHALQRIAEGDMPDAAPPSTPPTLSTPDPARPPLEIEQMDIPGAYVLVGYVFPGVSTAHADWPALQVLSAALGHSSRARLPQRLLTSPAVPSLPPASVEPANGEEEESAVAFEVSTQATPRRYAAELIIVAQTDAQSVDAIKNAILDEVRRVREEPLSSADLQAARNYARGEWPVTRQSPRERAFLAALPIFPDPSGKTNDATLPARLEAVTAADIQRVARQYLDRYAVALIMPEY